MRLPLFIANRYLFSKKKQNAINIISAISVVGVAVGTAALIIILSVFNGIDLLLKTSMSSLTPDLVITPATGKFMMFDTLARTPLETHPAIRCFSPVVEEKALLKYEDKLKPVLVKGIPESYAHETGFLQTITQGNFSLKSGDAYSAVVGYGVAVELGIGLNFLTPMRFYYPEKALSSLNNMPALHSEYLFPSAFFSSQQELDEKLVLTDIRFAQQLFRTGEKISGVEIKLHREREIEKVEKELQEIYGEKYDVKNKYELNRSFYAMMKSEKLVIYLILVFILSIASFNIVGSISMLIIDKREDLHTYKALGMTSGSIARIFTTEGNLITLLGGITGLVAGASVCLLQESYGFIKLGNGSYLMEAYPVALLGNDVAMVFCIVAIIGLAASFFPVRYLINKLLK